MRAEALQRLEASEEREPQSMSGSGPSAARSTRCVRARIRGPLAARSLASTARSAAGLNRRGAIIARHYAAWFGRWTGADPLGLEEPGRPDLNLYAYVRGRGISSVDPTEYNDEELNVAESNADPFSDPLIQEAAEKVWQQKRESGEPEAARGDVGLGTSIKIGDEFGPFNIEQTKEADWARTGRDPWTGEPSDWAKRHGVPDRTYTPIQSEMRR